MPLTINSYVASVLLLVPPGAFGHGGEELVGERLHDQRDPAAWRRAAEDVLRQPASAKS